MCKRTFALLVNIRRLIQRFVTSEVLSLGQDKTLELGGEKSRYLHSLSVSTNMKD